MLRSLGAAEREALFAHERAHNRAGHHYFLGIAELPPRTAIPPCAPVRADIRLAAERAADEDAACAVGDRGLTARHRAGRPRRQRNPVRPPRLRARGHDRRCRAGSPPLAPGRPRASRGIAVALAVGAPPLDGRRDHRTRRRPPPGGSRPGRGARRLGPVSASAGGREDQVASVRQDRWAEGRGRSRRPGGRPTPPCAPPVSLMRTPSKPNTALRTRSSSGPSTAPGPPRRRTAPRPPTRPSPRWSPCRGPPRTVSVTVRVSPRRRTGVRP